MPRPSFPPDPVGPKPSRRSRLERPGAAEARLERHDKHGGTPTPHRRRPRTTRARTRHSEGSVRRVPPPTPARRDSGPRNPLPACQSLVPSVGGSGSRRKADAPVRRTARPGGRSAGCPAAAVSPLYRGALPTPEHGDDPFVHQDEPMGLHQETQARCVRPLMQKKEKPCGQGQPPWTEGAWRTATDGPGARTHGSGEGRRPLFGHFPRDEAIATPAGR